ncbi:MAG: tetratricopeptide repeat protein [Acidobacteriaceae bacterium]
MTSPQTQEDAAPRESRRAAVERVLASSVFRGPGRASRFLQFAVNKTLSGEGSQLKEYRIALEVFGRSAAFDPRIDPIVRVEARRVRQKLQQYYAGEGANDPVRMEMPRGSYAITFADPPQKTEAQPVSEAPVMAMVARSHPRLRRIHWLAAASVALVLGLAVSILLNFWRSPRISAGTAAPSVAVLPFLNLTGNASQEYLSDGITDDLTSSLAGIPGLHVVARTSAFQFKSKAADIRQIGDQLHASSLVEGSVQSIGSNLAITVHLVRVADGYQIWSSSWQRSRSDLPAIEQQIGGAIAHALVPDASPPSGRVSTEAHELYLQGRYWFNRRSRANMWTAIDYYNQALSRDPVDAEAYLGLAETYAVLGANDQAPAEEVFPKARAAARRVLDLNGDEASAHAVLGHIDAFYDWDFPAAKKEFLEALQLAPSLAEAHHWYGVALLYQGQLNEAARQMEAVRDLDPLSLEGPLLLARVYFYAQDYDRSLSLSRATLPYDLRFALTHDSMALAYEWKGDYQHAVTEFEQYETLSEGDPDAVLGLAETYALMGDRQRALSLIDQLRNHQGTYVPAYGFAEVFAALGDRDEAYHWLDSSVDEHSASCVLLLVDPAFRSFRGEPRFQQLLRRTGHPATLPQG